MSEANESKMDGAVLQKNSGRGKYRKGDAVIDDFLLVDYKEYKKSFGINKAVWAKVSTDAVLQGYEPSMKLVIGEEGEPKTRLWLIGDSLMKEFLEYRRQVVGDM